jgi:hypothetical protein
MNNIRNRVLNQICDKVYWQIWNYSQVGGQYTQIPSSNIWGQVFNHVSIPVRQKVWDRTYHQVHNQLKELYE